MASNDVGSVLQINFVQGEDYLKNVLVSEANARNAAANAANSATQAENAKATAIEKAGEAASSAVYANASKEAAARSAIEAGISEVTARAYANDAANSEAKAKQYADETEAHYNQFYADLSRIENDLTVDIQNLDGKVDRIEGELSADIRQVENTLTNGLNHLTNTVNVQYRSLDDSRKAINEWIKLHDGAFSLVDFSLYDNNGEPIVDNDDTGFGGKMYMPITDKTLTLEGVPADAYSVGVAISRNTDLINQNTADIATNTERISQNTADIASNRHAIESERQSFNGLSAQVTENSAFIEQIRSNFVEKSIMLDDNDSVPFIDIDDEGFVSKAFLPITDDTLTLNGIPADAEAVGNAFNATNQAIGENADRISAHQTALSRIDYLLESWSDNFTQAEVAMADSDGDYLLDNDDEELLSGGIRMVTDDTLTVSGVPADAYAVGQALKAIRDLIATYHP